MLTNDDREWRRLWAHGLCKHHTRSDTQRRRCVRQLENLVQHNDRCQFCDKASCATAWQVSQSWQQLDGGSVVKNWIDPSSKPFACMYRHDSSCMASWRIHATRTPVNTKCLCDVARARKYGMFCTCASLVTNSTFTTLMQLAGSISSCGSLLLSRDGEGPSGSRTSQDGSVDSTRR